MKTPDSQPTMSDEVIAEIHRHKEAIAAAHCCDVDALLKSLREREKDNPRLVSRVPAANAPDPG